MPLAPGTRLGLYELQSQIGAGGMGEVYKARDAKLDRLVAIKVLPPSLGASGDLLARFEREAKAVAALNHPNILGIYDFGKEGDQSFAVMELLEGESLREKLKAGPLTPKRALEISQQMAEGLAAAHAKGIVHRDIKPENIFLTKEGRVKVLDFGLAKQLPGWTGGSSSQTNLHTQPAGSAPGPQTEAGVIMGTVGYMSPEQVKGEAADHRSDIFAFGVVLYEMLAGRQAFRKSTAVQTMAAILEEDPPELSGSQLALERLVHHCLEKEPGNRFQSMQDLAYALQNLSTLDSFPLPARNLYASQAEPKRPSWRLLAVCGAAVLLLAAALGFMGLLRWGRPAPPPTFKRLSFVPGTIESGRFGPDGRTIYFSERVAGGRPELFVLHPGAPGPTSLGIQDALVLGVSQTSELAILTTPRLWAGGRYRGSLARAPGNGGAFREVQKEVSEAFWDGEGLAALSQETDGEFRLEFPVGKVLLRDQWGTRFLRHLCLSRDGARLALVDGSTTAPPVIAVFDRSGKRRVLHSQSGDSTGQTLTGMAWAPDGDLWVSEIQGDQTALWALSMKGRRRIHWRSAGSFQLLDVSPEGRALLAHHQMRRGVFAKKAGEEQAQELSILGGTQATGISDDGQNLLLLESPTLDGGTARDEAYLRPLKGGPPLRLGRGFPFDISGDGRWVSMDTSELETKDLDPAWATALQEAGMTASELTNPKARTQFPLFVPTGLGRPFAFALAKGYEGYGFAHLLPDGQRMVTINEIKGKAHWVLYDRRGGGPRILTREGLGTLIGGLVPLSPDGTRIIVSGNLKEWFIQPLTGGGAQAIPGLLAGERVVGWGADGRSVHVRPEVSVLPVTITRLDLATGERTPVLSFNLADPAGHVHSREVFVTPSAQAFAFTYEKKLSELYLVEGLN